MAVYSLRGKFSAKLRFGLWYSLILIFRNLAAAAAASVPECAEDVLLGAVDVVAQRGDDPPPQQRPDALAPRLTLQRRADRHHLFVDNQECTVYQLNSVDGMTYLSVLPQQNVGQFGLFKAAG